MPTAKKTSTTKSTTKKATNTTKTNNTNKEIEKTTEYIKLRENLYRQLERRKALTPIYVDLIEDYMSFYVIKEKLKKDIYDRGVYITYNNGGGQSGETDNASIDKLLKVSNKMRDILKQLEINLDAVVEEDDEL